MGGLQLEAEWVELVLEGLSSVVSTIIFCRQLFNMKLMQ